MTTGNVRPAERLRIRASDWNAVRRAAQKLDRDPLELAGQLPGGLATTPSIVLGRNAHLSTVPRYGVVVLGAPLVTPGANEGEWSARIAVSCQPPSTNDQQSWLGVALQPVPTGKIGRICISGAIQAVVNVTSAGHKFAVIQSGTQYLQSAAAGPVRILWKEPTGGIPGEKRSLVALGASYSPPRLHFKLTGATLIAGRAFQWNYAGQEANVDADGLPAIVSGGLVATLRNRAEVMNGATFAAGMDPTFLPSAIEVQPIGRKKSGTYVGAFVEAALLDDGRWWFDRLNAPDGPCG